MKTKTKKNTAGAEHHEKVQTAADIFRLEMKFIRNVNTKKQFVHS